MISIDAKLRALKYALYRTLEGTDTKYSDLTIKEAYTVIEIAHNLLEGKYGQSYELYKRLEIDSRHLLPKWLIEELDLV